MLHKGALWAIDGGFADSMELKQAAALHGAVATPSLFAWQMQACKSSCARLELSSDLSVQMWVNLELAWNSLTSLAESALDRIYYCCTLHTKHDYTQQDIQRDICIACCNSIAANCIIA